MDIRPDTNTIKRTKKNLAVSLSRLAKEKPIDKITVTEICSDAEISRNAYYSHYEGIYAQMENIEDLALDVVRETLSALSVSPDRKTVSEAMEALAETVLEWRFVSELLLRTSAVTHLRYRVRSACGTEIRAFAAGLHPSFSAKQCAYAEEWMVDGTISCLRAFLREKEPDPQTFAEAVVSMLL